MTMDDRSPARGKASGSLTGTAFSTDQAKTPAPARGREFEFSGDDFERIRKLIHDHVGIALSPAKQDMVYSRLTRRLRACGDRSFVQYLARLERDRSEFDAFVNSLTTNLTSFFREAHHFEILAEQFKGLAPGRTFNIWCCAASTGEEPYSLAITACEAFKSLSPPVAIVASDVNTEVLEQARRAVYDGERVARLSPARIQQFFTREVAGGAEVFKVRPELQRLVSFKRINLLEPVWPVKGPFDAIFCRNVMIYFDKPTQYTILKRFAPVLQKDGSMFAGHSESFQHAADVFRPVGRTVYRRAI